MLATLGVDKPRMDAQFFSFDGKVHSAGLCSGRSRASPKQNILSRQEDSCV
jgi:hypothetical protein